MKRKETFLVLLSLLVLLFFGIYWFQDALTVGFIADDYWLIAAAQSDPFPYKSNWVGSLLAEGEDSPPPPFYRPLVIFSCFLNDRLTHGNSFAYHLVNLIIHMLCTVLLAFVLIRLDRRWSDDQSNQRPAWMIIVLMSAAFFFHPGSTVNVSWIAGRTDLLATLFILLSVHFYLELNPSGKGVLAVSLLFFLLALMSKEIAVLLPLFFLFFEIGERIIKNGSRQEGWLQTTVTKLLPFVVLLVCYLIFRMAILGTSIPNHYRYRTITEILQQVLRGYTILLLPVDSMTFYRFFLDHTIIVTGLISVILLVLLGAAFVFVRRRLHKSLLMSGLFLFATGVMMLFWFPQGGIAARLVYLQVALLSILLFLVILAFLQEVNALKAVDQVRWLIVLPAGFFALLTLAYCISSRWLMNDFVEGARVKEKIMQDLSQEDAILKNDRKVFLLSYPHAIRHAIICSNLSVELYCSLHGKFGRFPSVASGTALVGQNRESLYRSLSVKRLSENQFLIQSTDEAQSLLLSDFYYRKATPGDIMKRRIGELEVGEVHPYGRASSMKLSIDSTLVDTSSVYLYYSSGQMKRMEKGARN